jgi:AraC-like DNA-binding protein/quercetin dioxygenase-like cupin family protein
MEFQHELIIPNEGLPFKLFLFEGSQGNYRREKHWHTSIEIFAVLEGELSFFLNEEEYPLKPGEFMIINSNEIHSIYAREKNQTVVLQIPLNQFEDYFTAHRFIRFGRMVGQEQMACDQELFQSVRDLYRTYETKGQGYEFKMLSLFYQVLHLLVTSYRETEVREQEFRYSRQLVILSRVTGYMRKNYREDLKLSDLATRFGYSPEYLSRMFKKYVQVNFKTYMQDIRTACAYQELMHTDKTIAAIAMDNGFCDSRSFARDFRKRYGILPSDARCQQNAVKELQNVKKML